MKIISPSSNHLPEQPGSWRGSTLAFQFGLRKQVFGRSWWMLALLLLAGIRPVLAQTPTLEFTDGAGNTTGSGPVATAQVITFQNNTDNPAVANTFAAFTPTTTATFSLGNQLNTSAKLVSGSNVSTAFGATAAATGNAAPAVVFPLMNVLSLATDASPSLYTSAAGVTGGIDIAKNRSMRVFTSVEGIPDGASTATNIRYQMADVTITFSQPVVNPVIQITGLGGTSGALGFTTDFDLVTPGVSLSKLSGSATLTVSSTQIRNNATTFTAATSTASGATTGAASGSVLVTTPAAGITSITFTTYLRSDAGSGASGTWHAANNTTTHVGDAWLLGVSELTPAADLATTITGPANVTSAATAGPYYVTYSNNGPNVAPTVSRTVTLTVNNNGAHPASVTVNGSATLPAGVTYTPATGVLNFGNATNVASGGSSIFSFGYPAPTYAATTAASVSAVSNTTLSGYSTTEANTANNTATVTSNVQATSASADLAINITGLTSAGVGTTAPTTAVAGDFVYYIVTLSNLSATAATNVNLAVQLPTGYTEVSGSGNNTYNPATGQILVNVGTLAANATTTLRVRMRVPASGPYTVRAYNTADTTDPNYANNDGNSTSGTYTNQVTTAVTQVADVVTTINGPAQAGPNQLITYNVLSTNYGPSTATGVVTTLVLGGTVPTNASDVTVTDANGVLIPSAAYDPSTKTVTLTSIGATLTKGASQSYAVRFRAPATGSVTGKVANTATTANGDPLTANNDGTAGDANLTTTVVPTSSLSSGQCASFPAPPINGVFDGTTSINTYYAGLKAPDSQLTANTSGQKVVSLNLAAPVGTGATALAVGDLLMIIQMQGADIQVSNNNAYGNGYAGDPGNGQLSNANYTAGLYEYATVGSINSGANTITLNFNLTNSYVTADYNATTQTGQRRFQVIRLPRYQTLTLTTDVTNVPAWNGTTGGVLAVDIAGRLDLNGKTISLKGKGFRGGAGMTLTGGVTGTAGDYYLASGAAAPTGLHGSKGEGIVGTPRYVNNNGALLDNTAEGYPGGSFGRGAPGNAGGGGTDSDLAGNSENSGGGGGSNAGTGGTGGDNWSSNYPYGGNGGAPFLQASPSRLVMGGGGGAGSSNNGSVASSTTYPANTGLTANGFSSSGAAGGGMVFIRASSVSANAGTIDVSGNDMAYVPANDGAGGGGGGGSVLLLANNNVSLSAITVLATGGKGGSNTGGGVAHGPGGGGSGGIILTSAAVSASSSNMGGINGLTNIGGTGIPYGATAGTTGTPPPPCRRNGRRNPAAASRR